MGSLGWLQVSGLLVVDTRSQEAIGIGSNSWSLKNPMLIYIIYLIPKQEGASEWTVIRAYARPSHFTVSFCPLFLGSCDTCTKIHGQLWSLITRYLTYSKHFHCCDASLSTQSTVLNGLLIRNNFPFLLRHLLLDTTHRKLAWIPQVTNELTCFHFGSHIHSLCIPKERSFSWMIGAGTVTWVYPSDISRKCQISYSPWGNISSESKYLRIVFTRMSCNWMTRW